MRPRSAFFRKTRNACLDLNQIARQREMILSWSTISRQLVVWAWSFRRPGNHFSGSCYSAAHNFNIGEVVAMQCEFPWIAHRIDANLSCRRHGMPL